MSASDTDGFRLKLRIPRIAAAGPNRAGRHQLVMASLASSVTVPVIGHTIGVTVKVIGPSLLLPYKSSRLGHREP